MPSLILSPPHLFHGPQLYQSSMAQESWGLHNAEEMDDLKQQLLLKLHGFESRVLEMVSAADVF